MNQRKTIDIARLRILPINTTRSLGVPAHDRESGRPRGFGFVEVDDDAVQTMIQALDGKDLGSRALRVNETQDCPCTSGGGAGGCRW